jgi:hypothetical protein
MTDGVTCSSVNFRMLRLFSIASNKFIGLLIQRRIAKANDSLPDSYWD